MSISAVSHRAPGADARSASQAQAAVKAAQTKAQEAKAKDSQARESAPPTHSFQPAPQRSLKVDLKV